MITGAAVSSVTVLVTVVDLPALSVATTVIVFVPFASVRSLLNVPLDATVTASAVPELSLIVTLTGLDVTSFVVPLTVQADLFVISLSAGLERVSVGGTVSTLNVVEFVAAAFPS